MAKTKEDYAALGREDAQRADRGEALVHMPQGSKASWQTKAYDEAFADEMARLEDQAEALANEGRIEVKKIVKVSVNLQPTGVFLKGSGNMLRPIPPEAMPQTGMQGWPPGAAEHAARLKAELSKELKAKRATRLLSSLMRLYAKHDARAQQ